MYNEISTVLARIGSVSRCIIGKHRQRHDTPDKTYPRPSILAMQAIPHAGEISVADLAEKLQLSEIEVTGLADLLQKSKLIRKSRNSDSAGETVSLTRKGKAFLASLDDQAEQRLTEAFRSLPIDARDQVLADLGKYSSDVDPADRGKTDMKPSATAQIHHGYEPRLIGRVVEMHAEHYSDLVKIGPQLEIKIAGELSELVSRIQNPRNQVFHLQKEGHIVGFVAIDGEQLGHNRARLRWLLVDRALRGAGFGKQLLSHALAFCDDHGFDEIHLRTFKHFKLAQKLYRYFGFRQHSEKPVDEWGRTMIERWYVRIRPETKDV